MAPPAIQSLSIPSHSVAQTPPPAHVVFNIRISTPVQTYTVARRYSAFLDLHSALTALPNAPSKPPADLPPKRSSFFALPTSHLSEGDLLARRTALEKYLRTLLAHKDPFWAHSQPFLEFFQLPSASTSSATVTPAVWLTNHSTLQQSARALRALLARRDSPQTASAQSHTINLEAKRGLVDFVAGVEDLKRALDVLEKGGMVQGEVERRRDMLATLEDERDTLAVLVGNKPKLISRNGTANAQDDAPRDGKKDALLSGAPKPATRVLGAKAVETSATRALDNAGVLQLQQTYMDQQDERVNDLVGAIRRQRELGVMIGDELRQQEETMDSLEAGIDGVQKKLKNAKGIMRKLGS